VFSGFGLWRSRAGFISPARSLDLRLGAIWAGFTAAIAVTVVLMVYGLPLLMRTTS
jgi:cytochrome c oxidase subunit I+III